MSVHVNSIILFAALQRRGDGGKLALQHLQCIADDDLGWEHPSRLHPEDECVLGAQERANVNEVRL